jgi:hypothetical protein
MLREVCKKAPQTDSWGSNINRGVAAWDYNDVDQNELSLCTTSFRDFVTVAITFKVPNTQFLDQVCQVCQLLMENPVHHSGTDSKWKLKVEAFCQSYSPDFSLLQYIVDCL